MRGEARVKAAQPTTDNRCWGLTEAGSAGDFCAHCQRFLPSITTTGASAASNPSNRRALTPMRRVLPSHFPSASNAGLSLNVVQPQWAQKRCATCRACHHQVWRTARVLAGIGGLQPHLTASCRGPAPACRQTGRQKSPARTHSQNHGPSSPRRLPAMLGAARRRVRYATSARFILRARQCVPFDSHDSHWEIERRSSRPVLMSVPVRGLLSWQVLMLFWASTGLVTRLCSRCVNWGQVSRPPPVKREPLASAAPRRTCGVRRAGAQRLRALGRRQG